MTYPGFFLFSARLFMVSAMFGITTGILIDSWLMINIEVGFGILVGALCLVLSYISVKRGFTRFPVEN